MTHAPDVQPRSEKPAPAKAGADAAPAAVRRQPAAAHEAGAVAASERRREIAAGDGLGRLVARAVTYRYPAKGPEGIDLQKGRSHVDLIFDAVRAAEERIAGDIAKNGATKHDEGWKRMTDLELANAIIAIRSSPIDYGTIDLEDEQHTEALYYYLLKQSRREEDAKADAVNTTEHGIEAQEAKALAAQLKAADQREKAATAIGGTGRIVDVAYVGAGATVAYHVATRSPNADHGDALIIGEDQPWRHKRGKGLVGHPAHMISPMADFAGVDDTWLDRADLSDLIDAVFLKSLIPRLYTEVNAITRGDPVKDGHAYYAVTLADGSVVFARSVVFGAGTGAHNKPREEQAAVAAGEGEVEAKRVMDMDVFMRIADRLVKEEGKLKLLPESNRDARRDDITLVLTGPNAGIDVAFEALRLGYRVLWIADVFPAFLPGMGNAATQLAYARRLEAQGQTVTKAGGKPVPADDLDAGKVEERMRRLYAKGEASPEIEAYKAEVLEKFVNRTPRLDAIYIGRFKAARAAATGVTVSIHDRAKDLDGDLCVFALGQTLKPAELLKDLPKLVPIEDDSLRFGDKRDATILGEQSADGTLVVLGAAAAGHLRPERGKDHPMQPVIESLPLNVAAPDQLTPIRSAVSAATDHMPSNISGEANFITDDRTTIAVHISARYPRVADRPFMAEVVAEAIIKSRRETADWRDFTAEPPHGPRFQDHWRGTLELLNSRS